MFFYCSLTPIFFAFFAKQKSFFARRQLPPVAPRWGASSRAYLFWLRSSLAKISGTPRGAGGLLCGSARPQGKESRRGGREAPFNYCAAARLGASPRLGFAFASGYKGSPPSPRRLACSGFSSPRAYKTSKNSYDRGLSPMYHQGSLQGGGGRVAGENERKRPAPPAPFRSR